MLAHFDPRLSLCLAGDASVYGIEVVISHIFPNGEKRSIAYALCTLSSSEKNYAQLKCEALSLICIWCTEISPVSLWASLCAVHRPQTID